MKSEESIRYSESESLLSTNLVFHHGIANIFHKTVDSLYILRVVEEMGKIILGYHCLQSLANLSQLPGNSHASDPLVCLLVCMLTVLVQLLYISLALSH